MRFIIALSFLMIHSLHFVTAGEPLSDGTTAFINQRYDEAAIYFHKALENAGDDRTKGLSLLWLGKTCFQTGRFAQAEEYFLSASQYLSSENKVESDYYLGRVQLMRSKPEDGLHLLEEVSLKKNSPFAPMALFSLGEYWFESGNRDKAAGYYVRVRNEYPGSSRSEAAGYRLDMLELLEREARLLDLLKWSYQQNLTLEREFRMREQDYRTKLETERSKFAELAAKGTGFYNSDSLLDMKARAMILKRFYLDEYHRALREEFR